MGGVWMRKITEIPSTQDDRPMELRHLRVAAYCRVSTDLGADQQYSHIVLSALQVKLSDVMPAV